MGAAPATQTAMTAENLEAFQERARRGLNHIKRYAADMPHNTPTMGFEKEVNITDIHGRPLPSNDVILRSISRPLRRLLWLMARREPCTRELLKHQLEINSRPRRLRGRPFTKTRRGLNRTCRSLAREASRLGGKIVPTGILLGYRPEDFTLDAISPNPRYWQLNAAIMRRGPYDLDIRRGIEELYSPEWKNVAPEGATTSGQPHLTLQPGETVPGYNAARIAALPCVAMGAGSPVLFEQLAWAEIRIAVLEQSVGGGSPGSVQAPRSGLGPGWIDHPTQTFEEALAHTPLVIELPADGADGDDETDIKAFLMLYSTIWPWVRLVFGKSPKPHFRLEFRFNPSGTTEDDMANAAFAFGLTRLLMRSVEQWIAAGLDFEPFRHGFHEAARLGIDAVLPWPVGANRIEYFDASTLTLRLLPQVESELVELGVYRTEAARYLEIIRQRAMLGITPAVWIQKMVGLLESKGHTRPQALEETDRLYRQHVRSGLGAPVHTWPVTA